MSSHLFEKNGRSQRNSLRNVIVVSSFFIIYFLWCPSSREECIAQQGAETEEQEGRKLYNPHQIVQIMILHNHYV